MTPLWKLPHATVPHPKYPEIEVRLTGFDGNIFSIMGRISKAMFEGGIEQNIIKQFIDEVSESDSYENALIVCRNWVWCF